MTTKLRKLEIPEELERQIEREAASRDALWEDTAMELLDEGLRMRQVPGIAFMDGPTGRRAVIGGTGLDVWEIVRTWLQEERDFERLRESYDWLTDRQLRAALLYYEIYPVEINARLEREAWWTPERVHAELPHTRTAP